MDGIVAIKFEELVEERSGGAIQIERFPNCQLVGGNMERHVEMMVAGGAFELAIISTSSFNTVDNRFYIAGTPFLFPTYDAMWECMDSTGGEFMNKVYAEFFTAEMPARICFEVAALPKGALVEIDAIAVK